MIQFQISLSYVIVRSFLVVAVTCEHNVSMLPLHVLFTYIVLVLNDGKIHKVLCN